MTSTELTGPGAVACGLAEGLLVDSLPCDVAPAVAVPGVLLAEGLAPGVFVAGTVAPADGAAGTVLSVALPAGVPDDAAPAFARDGIAIIAILAAAVPGADGGQDLVTEVTAAACAPGLALDTVPSDRVARTLGPLVKYKSTPPNGKTVQEDVKDWFQKKPDPVTAWAEAHEGVAQALGDAASRPVGAFRSGNRRRCGSAASP